MTIEEFRELICEVVMETIHDEFSNLQVTPAWKHMLRNKKKGLCMWCKEPAISKRGLCLKHLVKNREYYRKAGAKRRISSKSYKIQGASGDPEMPPEQQDFFTQNRKERREQGICVLCGLNPSMETSPLCKRCFKK